MHSLWLEGYLHLRVGSGEGVEPECVGRLGSFLDARVAVAPGAGVDGGVAPAAADEVGAQGAVVGGLADDDRVGTGLEDTGGFAVGIEVVGECGLQCAHPVGGGVRPVERGIGCRHGHLDLHDGPGVGAVTGQRGRGADRAEVGSSGVVVVAGNARREGGGGVVVQDQRLPPELREVDDDIGAFGRRQQQ